MDYNCCLSMYEKIRDIQQFNIDKINETIDHVYTL